MAFDFRENEKKWQQVWEEQKTFEANPKPGTPKFFLNAPYPYVNGLPHLGHFFTYMHTEALARYKRARGYNVLYPQAWHCTGSPIVNAAKRVAEGDEKQIQILKDFGVTEQEIEQFKQPTYWIEYFAPRFRRDYGDMGFSIDWRREFITTSLNPRYDAFIRWQFKHLKDKNYVALGKHPVVWCPKEQAPVSDHSRLSGEGETPQEYVLILFKIQYADYIAVATLRPETIEGVTNLWVNPNVEYTLAEVDGQNWIVSSEALEKLAQQEHEVKILSKVPGKSLIGKLVKGPGTKTVPILPASFPTADKGTGIVMSVPSDSPDDYIALRDLQHNQKIIDEYKLDIASIKPIPIIDAGELGHTAAAKVVEDMKIASQKDRDRLEQAKKIVYKKGFYEGVMLSGEFKGEKVEKAKESIKELLFKTNEAHKFYELTGPVVCRCLTPCVAKIVSNQWFLTYGNPQWKVQAHACLDQMNIYPEKARQQFDYVLDWLNDWACTREEGLGTRLPWDEHWLIESLSDSTLYPAYYTIAHLVEEMPEHEVNFDLFEYVFLGKGTPKDSWKPLRDAFMYWYPFDYRHSGKDLIQNHLSFLIFNHVAIFGKEYWPKGFGVNGHVTVDGKKMSKSLGNFITMRQLVEKFGADASRLTILNGGEGLDDANWDSSLAPTTQNRLTQLFELIEVQYGKGREDSHPVDEWFESKLNSVIRGATEAMDHTNFRSALQHAWFSLGNILKQYLKLTTNNPHRELFMRALEAHVIMLQPFTPHASEEAWSRMGKQTLISLESWPALDESKIKPEVEASQDMIEQLAGDIRKIQTLLRTETVSEITLIVAPQWKYELVKQLRAALEETRNAGEVMRKLVAGDLKKHLAELSKLAPGLVQDPSRLPQGNITQGDELRVVEGAATYLQKTFGAQITVVVAEETQLPKASGAFPGKPAIVLK